MLTRRRLLAQLPPAFVSVASSTLWTMPAFGQLNLHRKPKAAPVHPLVYFGTATLHSDAKGIYRSRFDPAAGRLTPPELVATCLQPAFMAFSQAHGRRMLYVTNEGDAATSTVSSYAFDPVSGALQAVGRTSAGGAGPCYVAVDATGQAAFVADYAGGVLASYRIAADGQLAGPADRVDFHGDPRFGELRPQNGPDKERQDGPHPHSAQISPDNRFVIVNDLGSDVIAIFPFDPATARLGPATVVRNRVPGSGPRHLVFHPNGRWVYGVDEMACRIDQYLWNTTHAEAGLSAQAILTDTGRPVSTLPPGFSGKNTAAEIAIDSTGTHVYVSNRGDDSLVVFNVDQETGALRPAQRIGCGGKTPRHFTLDPTQRWLLCENQGSDSATVFSRDLGSGRLSGPVQTVQVPSPMFALFV